MEVWKDVKGYEGIYQVSNFGRVKSLMFGKEKLLKLCLSTSGYYNINLYNNKNCKTIMVHKLVFLSFKNISSNRYFVIDHIDNNKLNNNLNNLQLISNRLNSSKDKKSKSNNYNIYFNSNAYLIRMRINNKKYSISTEKNIKNAIYVRDYFINNILSTITKETNHTQIKELIELYKNKLKNI